ncbi:unnamed protein product [Rangifer tarandus platyrhynchus]|uniref:Uncharacterized protein n=1 Tax=Rangifer tarandus platyrhynchus TaxID=3082113 RepID=A0ABN8Z741_RANTA|nr:unnamed protein product [Rangifer tarandus platyrhynchus]
MDCGPTGSSVMGFSGQKYWSMLPFPLPGDLPDPGIELAPPALAGGFFTTESSGKPHTMVTDAHFQEPLFHYLFTLLPLNINFMSTSIETLIVHSCIPISLNSAWLLL